MTSRAVVVMMSLGALLVLPAAGAYLGAQGGEALIERAAAALADSPCSFEFELSTSGGEADSRRVRGSAVVVPLADGTSRYRVEATGTGSATVDSALAE